ncbi:MAG: CBS domain-containing protein [Myxococcales bacterium]|nr:CBS domain-containing protein [Myxococcales bacterium]
MFRVPVSVYMTLAPVAVRPEARLEEVAAALQARNISALPVTDAKQALLGVISRRDLLRVGELVRSTDDPLPAWRLPDRTAGEVMSRETLSVASSTSIKEAAALMLDHRVHRVFIEKERRLEGILTTRDVMRAIVEVRYAAPIHRFMTKPVQTIAPFEPLGVARRQLTELNVRGLVVAEEGWPVGMFAEQDALAARNHDDATPVEQVMGHEVLIQGPDVRAYRAAGRMASMHVRRIVVCDHGAVIGILTGFDLAGAAAIA